MARRCRHHPHGIKSPRVALVPAVLLRITRRHAEGCVSCGIKFLFYRFVSAALSRGADNVVLRLGPPTPVSSNEGAPVSASSGRGGPYALSGVSFSEEMISYVEAVAGVFHSTSMTSQTLHIQALGFQQVCSTKMKALRGQ